MKRIKTRAITLLALCIALNIVGSNIALMLKLPIYLDSIGTVLAAAVFGPLGGMLAGVPPELSWVRRQTCTRCSLCPFNC